jgi:glycosyltransferase involved in cell wall biosynthesis
MKILYITQYFYPEVCAPTNRALANVKYFADHGHDVMVLTEMPNHPQGVIQKDYKHKFFIKEKIDNYIVNRVWVFTNKKKNFITRILFYVSFMFFGLLAALIIWKKYDVVYVTSPPLFVGFIGLVLKVIHPKTKFVFEVRDLWPDVAVEMGELNNKKFIKLSKKLEMKIYERADKIISVTNYFKKQIIFKGIPKNKISVIRNGTDNSFLNNSDDQRKKKNGNKFTIIYAGNLGLAQNLSTVLYAASELREENIEFIFAGLGPEEDKLHALVKELTLDKVQFVGEISKEDIGGYFKKADCGIIPLKKIETFKGTIPSKIFDYMAFNLPILLGVDGESRQIVEESKAGVFFQPDDHKDLCKKILYLKNNPDSLLKMSRLGKQYVTQNFNRLIKAAALEFELLQLLENK